MTIPYNTDHGTRNAVLAELAADVVAAGGTVQGIIASTAGETQPNWVLFLNRIIAGANGVGGGAAIPTYVSLDYSAFQSVVKAVQAKLSTPPPAPTNTVLPVASFTSGTGALGSVATSTNGTWTGSPTFTFQWLRSGANIAGATGVSYTFVAADSGNTISRRTTGTNAGGTLSVVSNTLDAT
jgi:hypothetical protein